MTPTELIESAVNDRPASEPVLCTADTAECTCPEFCERDHDVD